MTALGRATTHLDKARQFLESAEITHEMELFDAATSAAVLSGINSKDAICLARNGVTAKTDNHARAITELKEAGRDAAALAPTFKRLLQVKVKAQYDGTHVTGAKAQEAVRRAQRMYDAAVRIVSQ